MGTSLNKTILDLESVGSEASFAELQIPDNLKYSSIALENTRFLKFPGFLTIHGEGETDGKAKIKFSSDNTTERRRYIKECINLYSFVLRHFCSHKVLRVILHPDTLSNKFTREKQIEILATSLTEIADKLEDIEFICIEPRGGDRQKKVLRAHTEDIRLLEEYLNGNNVHKIGLCIDVAQLFVVHGNEGTVQFLKDLSTARLPVKEFHISDVLNNKKIKNRVAMEVGTGSIDWQLVLPSVLQHCNNFLIETLGGVKVFERSKTFLEYLINNTI